MCANKIKVMTVVGTRPEIIKLSRVIAKLDLYTNHVLVHTGQNFDYELNGIFFKDLQIRKPDYFLNAARPMAMETIGEVLKGIDLVLEKEKPEAFLVLGDTNSALAVLAAKKKKIPIFHMEAGNRCYDQRVPEEVNRKIVDHVSDINMPYTDIAREYLLKEGIPADMIIKTGSPMYEVLNYYSEHIKNSDVLSRFRLSKKKYFVASIHREENVDSDVGLSSIVDVLNDVVAEYGFPIIFSVHPRTRDRLEKSNLQLDERINLLKPIGFFDYVNLQINACAVLSDSGTITEESSILGFPALNIRDAQERPEGFEEGSVIMTGLNSRRIKESLRSFDLNLQTRMEIVPDYRSPNVSEKVFRIIVSYFPYVLRKTWFL